MNTMRGATRTGQTDAGADRHAGRPMPAMRLATGLRRWSLALLGLIAATVSGCATTGLSPVAPVLQRTQDWVQELSVRTIKRSGERELLAPGPVAQELGCAVAGAPLARSERVELTPERPRPGRELHQRWVYAACPSSAEALTGTLIRRLVLDGRTLFEDRSAYVLKPGRWAVEVFIGIPPGAPLGTYRLDLRFERRGLVLDAPAQFAVVAER